MPNRTQNKFKRSKPGVTHRGGCIVGLGIQVSGLRSHNRRQTSPQHVWRKPRVKYRVHLRIIQKIILDSASQRKTDALVSSATLRKRIENAPSSIRFNCSGGRAPLPNAAIVACASRALVTQQRIRDVCSGGVHVNQKR